jgi:hypothetical protein
MLQRHGYEYSDLHLPAAGLPSGVLVARQTFAPDLKCSPRNGR